ncbi:hypothetical protein AVEN_144171-1 [Araneus ventricosus]|uniref:Uncharacterized protein n=1 Tax=Araneus ventricosus TaxID=182803 RepID=A0A4Y2GAP7_ARAVE|nr:hypothetical protein AVEN_144171-1 [Araneus ventricosus]
MVSSYSGRGSGGLMVGCRLRWRMFQGSTPDFTENPRCMWAYWALNHIEWVKYPSAGVVRRFGEGEPSQVSSSSSYLDSTLRGPSQNNPRVPSKR